MYGSFQLLCGGILGEHMGIDRLKRTSTHNRHVNLFVLGMGKRGLSVAGVPSLEWLLERTRISDHALGNIGHGLGSYHPNRLTPVLSGTFLLFGSTLGTYLGEVNSGVLKEEGNPKWAQIEGLF
jgi:hypothetical protein